MYSPSVRSGDAVKQHSVQSVSAIEHLQISSRGEYRTHHGTISNHLWGVGPQQGGRTDAAPPTVSMCREAP